MLLKILHLLLDSIAVARVTIVSGPLVLSLRCNFSKLCKFLLDVFFHSFLENVFCPISERSWVLNIRLKVIPALELQYVFVLRNRGSSGGSSEDDRLDKVSTHVFLATVLIAVTDMPAGLQTC